MNAAKLPLIGIVFLLIGIPHAIALEIKLPVTSQYAERDAYKIGLLKLVLEKTNVHYTITTAPVNYTQARIITSLKRGSDRINLYWMGTSSKIEKDLLPIRFPAYKGLLGYRIFIIHKNDQPKFNHVQTLVDLQNFRGIQGIGWADNEILEHSGLPQRVGSYESIFKMVNKGGRIDYFSRGVGEAFVEVGARHGKLTNLAVEKNVLLVYPFALFFFTSRKNQELANILEEGFRRAYQDGSFDQYFYSHPDIKKIFKQANLENRIRIDIPNPLLTAETASLPNHFWHGR